MTDGAYIGGFHLDALTSSVALNVDLDTTLTVVAGNRPSGVKGASRRSRDGPAGHP